MHEARAGKNLRPPDAPPTHFVFTVCDRAAQEVCPIWPGQPMTAHWGIADPAAVEGTDEEKQRVFSLAFRELAARRDSRARCRTDRGRRAHWRPRSDVEMGPTSVATDCYLELRDRCRGELRLARQRISAES